MKVYLVFVPDPDTGQGIAFAVQATSPAQAKNLLAEHFKQQKWSKVSQATMHTRQAFRYGEPVERLIWADEAEKVEALIPAAESF